MNGCSSEALTKDQNSSSVYLLRSLTNVLNDTPTFCCTSPCSNFNPICHGVFLTFVVMQWGGSPSSPLFSWLTNSRGLLLLSTSHPPFMNKMSVRSLLTSFFFWWRHHKLKAPTKISSFLRIWMGCLIFTCV